MWLRRCLFLLIVTVAMGCGAFAQTPDVEPGQKSAPMPVVSFELNWKVADPQWYAITIEPTGRTSYVSKPKPSEGDTPGDPFKLEFTATEETRQRVFELAKQANYFKGDFEYKGKNIAQTGVKTLTYKDGEKQSQTSFNYSTNPAITELTSLFQRISGTLEAGRKLGYSLRFDKLGVDSQLKKLEDMKRMGALVEVQALEPMLKQIINDHSYMNVSRQRAQRLLGMQVSPAGSR